MKSQFATGQATVKLADIPKNIISHLQMQAMLKDPPLFGPKPPPDWLAEVKTMWPKCGICGHDSKWIAAVPNPDYKVPVLLQTSGGVKTNDAWKWDDAHIILSVGPEIGDKTPKPPAGWHEMSEEEKLSFFHGF